MNFIHSLLRDADPAAAAGSGVAAVAAAPALAAGAPPAVAGNPITEPWHKGFVRDDGTINRDSFGRMPDAFKGLADGELKNITTAEQLMSKLHGLSVMAGKKALAPLPPGSKPEDVQAQQAIIRQILGVPEKADGYDFKRPDDLPEEHWDAENASAAMAILHKHGAPPALAKELLGLHVNTVKKSVEAQSKYAEEFFKAQDDEFRAGLAKSGDDYDKVMELVNGVAKQFGMQADNPILKNAGERAMLHEVAKVMGESKFKGGAGADVNTKTAQVQFNDIVSNKANPDYEAYWDAANVRHKEVAGRAMALAEQAGKERAAQLASRK